jgi:hypothetical protein
MYQWSLKTKMRILLVALIIIPHLCAFSHAEQINRDTSENMTQNSRNQSTQSRTIFDDQMLLDGYTKKYGALSKETLLAMIKDDTLTSYRSAAAVKVFQEKYIKDVVSNEKRGIEKILLRRLHRTESPFVQVEIMYALCQMDRFRYFKSMAPALTQKLSHYNTAVNENAFNNLDQLIKTGNNRSREARIIFNTLRKILFLSRKRLATVEEPDPRLAMKLKLLRWSIKVLGNQELKKLPKEVINLL